MGKMPGVQSHRWLGDRSYKQAMEDIIYDEIDSAFEKETEAREQMDSLGMKCYYPTDEEMELWYAKANEVYEEYRNSIGGDLIDEAIALRDAYK